MKTKKSTAKKKWNLITPIPFIIVLIPLMTALITMTTEIIKAKENKFQPLPPQQTIINNITTTINYNNNQIAPIQKNSQKNNKKERKIISITKNLNNSLQSN